MTKLRGKGDSMALTGSSRFQNLTPAESVVFGDTHVPRRVGYTVDGAKGSPSLRIVFECSQQAIACTEVHVAASADGRGIRTGDLAALPALERLGVEAFAEFAVTISDGREGMPDWWESAGRLPARTRADIRTRGDAELREVARVYRENVGDRPREAVAAAMGLELRTASRRIEAARRKGYLPPTTQGKRKA
jgi:hypothetical protein